MLVQRCDLAVERGEARAAGRWLPLRNLVMLRGRHWCAQAGRIKSLLCGARAGREHRDGLGTPVEVLWR